MSSRSRRSRSPRFKRRKSTVVESTGMEDRPPDPISSSPSKFDQLLELINWQNYLISEQSKALNAQKEEIKAELQAQLRTMDKHTTMLSALEKDATRDDRALDGKDWDNDQTWGALDKESLAKIKVMVDEWRDLMQISLVFIALFLTVVTAFISPIIQVFTTPTNTDGGSTKNQVPSVPLQLVALFYYMALISSIFNSVLCVLGMQWGARLIATPLGKTNLERALARENRMLSAEGKMRSLMGVLIWTLLLSIGFFVLGFLIQLWDLSFSFTTSAPILIVGGVFATGLTLIILGIITVTTVHAGVNDNSPFESPLSNAMKPLLRWIRRRIRKRGHSQTEDDRDKGGRGESKGTTDKEDVAALIKWQTDDAPNILALKTYARLVLNTNDAEVLERTVPSFEFGEWYAATDSLLPVFHAIRDRFLATDTSFRVKETVDKQLVYLKDWHGWGDQGRYWRSDPQANDFMRWCQGQCFELIYSSRGSRRDFFPPFALFASLEEDNEDLRQWASDSNERCLADILCTFDSDQELGDRYDIFRSAVYACGRLLWDERTDDVTAILSHVHRASVLRSLIRNPHTRWFEIRNLVTFITKGREVETLDEMSDFFSNLPEMSVTSDDNDPLLVCEFLEDIIRTSTSDFATPHSLDLSPVLDLVDQNSLFKRYSETLIYYLDRGGLHHLSDLHSALRLWEYSRGVCNAPGTSAEVVTFNDNYHYCFIPLPHLCSDEYDDLAHNICALMAMPINKFPIKVFKRPILELLDLDDEQRNAVVTRILSKIQRSDFVTLLITKSLLPWICVQDLVLATAKDHELEILTALSDFGPSDFPSHTMSVFLDLSSCLVPSLPSDFTVPPSFDLSDVIFYFVRSRRDRRTWRTYTETMIAYFDHGAFDQSHRADDAAQLFKLCISDSQKMKEWDEEEQTSEHTRQRAIFYRAKLKARATQDPDLAYDLRPYFPEGFDQPTPVVTEQPQSLEKAAPPSRFQKWRNVFKKAPRRTMSLDNGPDIELELGTTGGLIPDQDRP
ncbi:hypothetical protein SISNIDRAFT_528660 [Sistotremastrum niveocremeum HHB9708]|uniref:DUF6535 domain-containing protein n=1 Tax=Sistotremastrum niveocremeum HHB9708 TaxID=1314777 RepID=A0A164PN81_9AGAM|nr:hypothetical protein SISNIDRAFT_528660 [Sistotremastrum niveocremeum HHB9708]